MDKVLLIVLLALVVILCVVVVILLTSILKMKSNLDETSKKIDEANAQNAMANQMMKDSFKADLQNVNENVRGIQNSMQQTVSQSYTSLNQTIDTKIQNSFNSISSYLQILNQDMGEMKNLAGGIDDVKKVLSNVKTRGILGEIQLGSILKEILAPQQYETNVVTVPGSKDRVEFAVKLPADGNTIYLPIDSKFPGDAYAHLVDAYNAGNEEEVIATKKILAQQFKNEAKDISTKYLKVPYTTDFGIMFLPFEGLYSEAVNMGVIEILQNDYHVIIAGPSTMAALLNSLQMGFRTLAIQANAEKVWTVLGNVKGEFETFAAVLEDTQKNLSKAGADLDKLVGTRTRQIQRALKDVEVLDGSELLSEPVEADYDITD